MSVFDDLKTRGLIYQHTDEDKLKDALDNQHITLFLGVDPTGDSLHVGHLAGYMTLTRLAHAGHKVIALFGGGTALIGDPSGRAEDRVLMDRDTIEENTERLKKQLQTFVELDGTHGWTVDNYEWLSGLELIPFLRDIGSKFRVNDMVKAEGYRERLERESGLSFLEFSYQLMQAYDYLKLYEDHNCTLQMGGSDQWGNIVAGVSLIRRSAGKEVHAFTIPLLTTADGKKMGKTEAGAVWLDAEKTPPYEFYQYWINVDDADVERFLKIFTFLDSKEIAELAQLTGADTNHAKERLAFEVTAFVHGEEAAQQAQKTSSGVFGGAGDTSSLPTSEISSGELDEGMNIIDFLITINARASRSEARRLIEQGGVYVADTSVESIERVITLDDFSKNELIIRFGKKKHRRVVLV